MIFLITHRLLLLEGCKYALDDAFFLWNLSMKHLPRSLNHETCFFFCSKMHLKLAFSNSFWQIQPNFNPATPKRPGLKQVLQAFKREKLKHVLRLGDHRDLSINSTEKLIHKSSSSMHIIDCTFFFNFNLLCRLVGNSIILLTRKAH